MANEQIRIDLEAKDDASDKIDDVADAAAELEDLSPEIEVTADTAAASSDLEALDADVVALSKRDAEIVLAARVDAARGELAALRADLDQTGDKAADTARQIDKVGGAANGPGLKTNAISDLTGPLGDASGAASTFGQTFEGLADVVGAGAAKIGLGQDAVAKLSGMVGGLGVAVAAGAAAWSYFQQRQEEARKKSAELAKGQRELTDAIRDGDRAAGVAKFAELYADAVDAASRAGIPMREVVALITGAADASKTLEARQREMTQAFDDGRAGQERYGGELVKVNAEVVRAGDEMSKARDAYAKGSDAIVTQKSDLNALEVALFGAEKATGDVGDTARDTRADVDLLSAGFDTLRGKLDFEQAALTFAESFNEANSKAMAGTALTAQEVLDLKNDYLSVAEEIGLNPVQVRSDLQKIEDGDIAEVLFATQSAINNKPPITAKLRLELEKNAFILTGAGGGQAFSVQPTSAPTINVTQVLPRGYRELDVIGAASRAARRSGGLYHRVRR